MSTEMDLQGHLTVNVESASNMGSGADCYCQVFVIKDALLGSKKVSAMKTSKERNGTDPQWNFSKTINLKGRYEGLLVRVKDSEFFKDKFLGEVRFSAEDIASGGKSGTFPLGTGSITMSFSYEPVNVYDEFKATRFV